MELSPTTPPLPAMAPICSSLRLRMVGARARQLEWEAMSGSDATLTRSQKSSSLKWLASITRCREKTTSSMRNAMTSMFFEVPAISSCTEHNNKTDVNKSSFSFFLLRSQVVPFILHFLVRTTLILHGHSDFPGDRVSLSGYGLNAINNHYK